MSSHSQPTHHCLFITEHPHVCSIGKLFQVPSFFLLFSNPPWGFFFISDYCIWVWLNKCDFSLPVKYSYEFIILHLMFIYLVITCLSSTGIYSLSINHISITYYLSSICHLSSVNLSFSYHVSIIYLVSIMYHLLSISYHLSVYLSSNYSSDLEIFWYYFSKYTYPLVSFSL